MEDVENKDGNDQTDSFDEIKGEPINMEPVFSTASGIRIDVKAESIARSAQLFQKDIPNKVFSSPVVKNHGNAFVSPFRNISSSDGTKRAADMISNDLLVKREKLSDEPEKKSLIGKVVRIEVIPEMKERRLVFVENLTKRKMLIRQKIEAPETVKLFDFLKIENYNLIRADEEVVADRIFPQVSDSSENEIHSFSYFPYTREPCFIHQLRPKNENDIQIAVLKVNIVDFGPKLYKGCSNCRYRFISKNSKSPDQLPENCPKCGIKAENKKCIYSIIRVVDFSGQLEVHVPHDVMHTFLLMLGYKDIDEMDKFANLQEQMNFLFRPVMIRIQRRNQEEWIAEEFGDVDWEGYSKILERKFSEMQNPKLQDKVLEPSVLNVQPMDEQ
ncbi:unnamed protein product [Caenorhabditis angaria]|uniref:Uncharacterized protein n=1 Tax=Caenorhabditis angaria TaxID=860376 RepID=A0A9P1IJD0_9PELO|nr:unnamed protein product [Caenorhabditis angaria]